MKVNVPPVALSLGFEALLSSERMRTLRNAVLLELPPLPMPGPPLPMPGPPKAELGVPRSVSPPVGAAELKIMAGRDALLVETVMPRDANWLVMRVPAVKAVPLAARSKSMVGRHFVTSPLTFTANVLDIHSVAKGELVRVAAY